MAIPPGHAPGKPTARTKAPPPAVVLRLKSPPAAFVKNDAVPVTLLIAALLVGYAVAQPRRGASPYVARLLDVIEFLSLASLLPLVGMVIGLYARLRSNGG